MNMNTMTSTYAQRNFGKILDELDEPVVIMRDSKPEKVIMDYADYQDYLVVRRKMMSDRVKKALVSIHEQTQKMPEKELDDLIKEALHEAGRD